MTRLFGFRPLVSSALFRRSHQSVHNSAKKISFGQDVKKFNPGAIAGHGRSISTTCKNLKKKDDDEYEEVEIPKRPIDDPFGRAVKILKHDFRSVWDKTQPPLLEFSSHVDIVIIGGGVVGSAIAYFIKERIPRKALSVMVIDKDPTYTRSSTVMSVGGLRKHFTLKENIQMAQFGAEFLRQVPQKLACGGEKPPDIQYHPYGYLYLANEEQAPDLEESWLMQKELGCHVELLTKERLKDRFPWMNTDGVELACYGTENEGWFDSWALLFGLKRKAIYHGTEYVQAEVMGFQFERSQNVVAGMDHGERHEAIKRLVVKTPHGEMKTVDFAYCIVAAGYESASICEMARIGRGEGILSVPLPVEARKRYVYCVQAPEGPGIDCPLVSDTNGSYFRREGYAGHFVAGQAPPLEDEPNTANLDVDYGYFDNVVHPSISHRVPGFRAVKLNSAWAGYYDYNTFDQSGIIGPHPYYPNLYLACGFSGHGIQQAPAAARGVMEMILDGEFRTIDLVKFHFERFLVGKEIKEKHVN